MFDFGNFPRSQNADVQIFTRPCTAISIQGETWRKPRGVSMVSILCIGGGGGGGGGFTGAASSARGGGGGGGSSGGSKIVIPAHELIDSLWIEVGAGGQGVGSGGGTAGSGALSHVLIQPSAATGFATNIIIGSGGAGAGGGGTGTGAAIGSAGVASTIGVLSNMNLLALGVFTLIGGQVGFSGGAVAGGNGTNSQLTTTSVVTQGGSGGGGTTSADFAGGGCTGVANSWLGEQIAATPAAGSNNGSGGTQCWKPFFSFGGLGGSSSNTGIGGAGGNGAFGAGGGGGGGGTTGGRGGDGGSGIVIIVSW